MGLLVAIVAGLVIGKLGMEQHLEDWVRAMQNSQPGGVVAAGILLVGYVFNMLL